MSRETEHSITTLFFVYKYICSLTAITIFGVQIVLLTTFLKTLALSWPFIREIFLGKRDLGGLIRDNQAISFLIFTNLLLLIAVVFMVDVSVSLNQEVRTYQNQITKLEQKLERAIEQANTLNPNTEYFMDRITDMETRIEEFQEHTAELENQNTELRSEVSRLSYQLRIERSEPDTSPDNPRFRLKERLRELREREKQQ